MSDSGALDVRTRLRHFAIVTFAVDPDAVRRHVHPRFAPELITDDHGHDRALISVVPFFDDGFTFVRAPWPRWSFGQTNYRAYVRDSETGERAVWFFGTALDFIGVVIPRYAWRLPWHKASIRSECDYDSNSRRYRRYLMTTTSRWAPARLELEDTGMPIAEINGYTDRELGMTVLTHPLRLLLSTRRSGRHISRVPCAA